MYYILVKNHRDCIYCKTGYDDREQCNHIKIKNRASSRQGSKLRIPAMLCLWYTSKTIDPSTQSNYLKIVHISLIIVSTIIIGSLSFILKQCTSDDIMNIESKITKQSTIYDNKLSTLDNSLKSEIFKLRNKVNSLDDKLSNMRVHKLKGKQKP